MEIHRYCIDEDEEVPYDEIANGYETDDDEMVILTDAELAAAAPHRSRTIDIEAFVDLDDVDPIYFDHPYVLMPSGEAEGIQRAYRMLVEVMARYAGWLTAYAGLAGTDAQRDNLAPTMVYDRPRLPAEVIGPGGPGHALARTRSACVTKVGVLP